VHYDVGVAVAGEPGLALDVNPGKHQPAARREAVYVIAVADPYVHSRRSYGPEEAAIKPRRLALMNNHRDSAS
jgi:hypothetical protein